MKTPRGGKAGKSSAAGGRARPPRPAPPPTASPGPAAWQHLTDDVPDLESIVIDDGAAVDNIFSEKQMRLLTEPLYSSWAGPEPGRQFLALADVGLFYSVTDPPLVPDVILSVDVSQSGDLSLKENRSYFVWRRGKVPDVVIEIVSNREGAEDTDKLAAYARLNIPYYVIFDPFDRLGGGVLRVLALTRLRYEPVAPKWLEGVGLGLMLWKGPFEDTKETWLRWCDKSGKPIPTGAEKAAREAARARKAEKAKAEAEEEIKRLRAKLRAAGLDPDANGR
ncbi:MAG TPA: Uma2 family endonuclease [Gemmataceae bacterium]|nr:Uma2 family endonuclease [Gemmataceae bacterium]